MHMSHLCLSVSLSLSISLGDSMPCMMHRRRRILGFFLQPQGNLLQELLHQGKERRAHHSFASSSYMNHEDDANCVALVHGLCVVAEMHVDVRNRYQACSECTTPSQRHFSTRHHHRHHQINSIIVSSSSVLSSSEALKRMLHCNFLLLLLKNKFVIVVWSCVKILR